MNLSRRLQAALSYTKGFKVLHDVGCDHAYLPLAALEEGYVESAIASDNKPEPLENARQNILAHPQGDRVRLLLSEGLIDLSPSTDLVSILGMGGIMISQILSQVSLEHVKRLILSPNSDADVVRKTLSSLDFAIVDETFLSDKGKYYCIIVAQHGNTVYTPLELRFGPVVLQKKNNAFVESIQHQIEKLSLAKLRAKHPDTIQRLDQEIAILKGVLA